MKNETCKIEMPYDPTEFRSTVVKPYYRASTEDNEDTDIVSDDEQMLSDENEPPNDKRSPSNL